MNPFKQVQALRPGRSVFNLSYEKKLTCDFGELIPIMCDEVVPGDTFNIGLELVVRFQPMVAPCLHEINAFVHYFYVPYRLLWDEWEDFITGGVNGTNASVLPRMNLAGNNHVGSLWDYLGFPAGVDVDADNCPMAFPFNAYMLIWNEYYRDENQQAEADLNSPALCSRSWSKDYFTSALPWQQRGTPPALPVDITGSSSAVWPNADPPFHDEASGPLPQGLSTHGGTYNNAFYWPTLSPDEKTALRNALNMNSVNLGTATATTFDIADLRLAFQIQKWMERNARGGVRYTEALLAHFGVSPSDERLQRPEYIGGTKVPIIMSEVLQTSESNTTPQGTMAGHGIAAGKEFIAKYHASEYGLIMGIMSIVPKPAYMQGIDRQWNRKTRLDFYWPEFAHLSEQAIERKEIFANSVKADNEAVWGFQGRYDEMRVKNSMICGQLRMASQGGTMDYWHLAREFDSAPALNGVFLDMSNDLASLKRIFAVQDEDGLIVNVGNVIKAIRPLPILSTPGLIDHQ